METLRQLAIQEFIRELQTRDLTQQVDFDTVWNFDIRINLNHFECDTCEYYVKQYLFTGELCLDDTDNNFNEYCKRYNIDILEFICQEQNRQALECMLDWEVENILQPFYEAIEKIREDNIVTLQEVLSYFNKLNKEFIDINIL